MATERQRAERGLRASIDAWRECSFERVRSGFG
jgi:hypothetical protein